MYRENVKSKQSFIHTQDTEFNIFVNLEMYAT